MSGYRATLKGGQKIFIPTWPVSVAYENLTKAGKYIGSDALVRIAELNMAAAMVAIMESNDAEQTSALIKHFVCTVRMDGDKIEKGSYEDQFRDDLALTIELFCHVIKAVYSDFFEQGLAEAPSQEG